MSDCGQRKTRQELAREVGEFLRRYVRDLPTGHPEFDSAETYEDAGRFLVNWVAVHQSDALGNDGGDGGGQEPHRFRHGLDFG